MYSYHLFLISSASVSPYHFCPLLSPSLREMLLGISKFLKEISSLSLSIVFLYFFALITKEGFLISPCYSLELCIQMGISFLFSLAFCFSFLNYSQGLLRKSFCLFAFLLLGDGFDHLLLYNVTNLCPLFFGHSIRSNPLTICHSHCMIIRDSIVPKWSSDFPYFFQFKSEFCNK